MKQMCAHPNPLIYLRGISAQDLTYLLDFIYYGEVNVAQDELDKFLEVAESLKIKGLTQTSNRSRPNKRTASSAIVPFLSNNEPSKKLKVHSDVALPFSSKTDHGLLFKGESDPLVPIDSVDCNVSLKDDNVYGDEHYVKKFVDDRQRNMKDEQSSSQEEKKERNDTKGNGPEYTDSGGGKHLSESERITLVNLIKTLDKEEILRVKVLKQDSETKEKRKILWNQIVSAFNDICGRQCDVQKLKYALNRIKRNAVITKAHSLLYDEYDDNHISCRFKGNLEDNAVIKGDDYVKELPEDCEKNDDTNEITTGCIEMEQSGGGNINEPEHTGPGAKHISETERITLVNLIKTLDVEDILRMKAIRQDPVSIEKRKILWAKIVSSFNEICNRTCDVQKLKDALNRIKRNSVITKAHS